MGSFKSAGLIIGLVIYFFTFFLIVSSIHGAKNEMGYGDNSLVFNDPGFTDQGNLYTNTSGGQCSGTGFGAGRGRAMNFLEQVLCKRLLVDDENSCNAIEGCLWQNATNFFNVTVFDAECTGIVNSSRFGINLGPNRYCGSEGINDEINCTIFACDWLNQSTVANLQYEATTSAFGVWDTIKFMATFRASVGISGYNFIFAFIFFWIPLLTLVLAIFFAIPVIHTG